MLTNNENKNKERIFYKVVRKRDKFCKDLSSAIINDRSIYKIKYKTHSWRKPILKNSKIFIFDTLYHAKEFLNSHCCVGKKCSIYECLAKNAKLARGYSLIPDDMRIHFFWEYYSNPSHQWNNPPSGTYFADAIKLLKKVY